MSEKKHFVFCDDKDINDLVRKSELELQKLEDDLNKKIEENIK